MTTRYKLGFYFWTHLLIIILVWSSPFWLNWRIILIFLFLYYLQLITVGNCIINVKQFNTRDREENIYGFILERMGFKINKRIVANVVDFIAPWIILSIAIIWQVRGA